MAMGAERRNVVNLVVKQGMGLTLVGIAVGVVSALILARFLTSFLYGVRPTDPGTIAGVSLLLAGVALLASYLPARRAASVDPLTALRCE